MLFLYLSVTGLYSQNKAFSRWSIWAEYGYNYLDGDINQNTSSIFPSSFREITYGGGLEYAFSPVWGISADYSYFPLKAENTIPSQVNISTYLHAATLNATINFTRWIFPETKSKIHILGSVGLGYAYYEYYPIDRITGVTPTNVILNDQGRQIGQAGSVPVTFSAEYNFSRPLALGAKFHYRAYTKDNLEGVSNLNWKGVTNDYIAAASVYLRYKFRSVKKDHVRNLRWQDYAPDLGLSTALEAKREIAALTAKVNTVDKKVGEIDTKVEALDGKVNALTPRIENMEKLFAYDGPDTDNDGVPDVRDRDNNTPDNTEVDFWGLPVKSSIVNDGKTQISGVKADSLYVFFDYDSYRLDEDALIAISKVAMHLLNDSSLVVEVRGYADFSGNKDYNLKLSKKRAEIVKKELVNSWEIDEKRIGINPKGRLDIPQKVYRPNRRCSFYFANK